ncbi:frizzled and smoothened-like protein P [Aspergillus udagawae]|uniref:Frizzled and smoothened-like protein P n=1 Tax=Aspergillus udagawae TaxID=91492 RepID=A0A8E0R2J3_9EURO|nr:uncharacterized protein Aud_010004 [Aspergillus udagawae]GFF23344.1 frizzled and smoothened-like protein P [Aspergillus udagawae]GFF43386.1 frizzled and smoothened-like protein P [Aspergillus udagawae]GFG08994.1 frizzled and smoothened-like protein P [Aspergillus udagawae]GIC93516.1 hypothetical protein Aud_010004 [Aspergillus udagawae]
MTNRTVLNGLCPVPFLQEDLFPSTGGFIGGRYCQPVGDISCCLPCPIAAWTYGDELFEKASVASWISVAILPLCIFLLVSYAVLPVKFTHRHYLSICFTLGICFMEIAFIIPLGVKPDQCHNQITPNDMHSSVSCAFTGALLLFGGWMVVVWSFLRTVAFHLQVCWEVILGPKFMWGALIFGWVVPAVGLTVMLLLTGVSFRFGTVCHINIDRGLQDYWIPIISFSVAALILQLATMGYCIHVYVKSLFDTDSTTNSSGLPSYSASVRTVSARQAYRRIRRVLQLQWRGVALVLIIIANVIFFAVTFIDLDSGLKPTRENMAKATPWIACLAASGGDRKKCDKEAAAVRPSEGLLLAVLILLSLVGFWNFILFARPSLFRGWVDFFKNMFGRGEGRLEFVSADARARLGDTRSYEMLNSTGLPSYKSPSPMVRSPSPARMAGTKSPENGHFGRDARYVRPSMSFSSPRPPSASQGRDWDPKTTFAPAAYREDDD